MTITQENLWLNVMLDLKRAPVGIRFLYDPNDYAQCTQPNPTVPVPYCVAVKNAAMGKPCKLSLEHIACLSGARVLGLLKPEDDIVDFNDIISGRRHAQMGLYADYCISRQVAKDMTYCAHKVYGVEIAELSLYQSYQPDIVIIVTNPLNAMRLIQGYAYHYGQLKNIKVTGNQAFCQECTSYPFETNQTNISLLCSGTRRVARWDDEEMGIGIPYNQLEKIVDGIRQTATPMADNNAKERIFARAQAKNVTEELNLKHNNNYYTGGYGTLAYHKHRQHKITPKNTD